MIGRMQIKARTVGSELARREEPEGAKSKGTRGGCAQGLPVRGGVKQT